ncbi:hypothetical protein KRP22_001582 [Phytophthora ramorum]|nr:hypothetical protein KRP22_863 [Phytophthora ramorum]
MALASSQPARTQPTIHYLFLDLDPLISTVKAQVVAQPTVYPQELTRMSADGVMLNAERLTALLDGQEERQQPALVICRTGSYFNCSQENAQVLQTVGWSLKKKGAIDHRTLENLLERNLEQVGACSASAAPKTMILATGELRPPTHSCIQAYLQSGWRVKLFCLQRCWRHALDDLSRAYEGHFTAVYLDQHLMELLATSAPIARPASTSPRRSPLWDRVSVRRSNLNSTPNARALSLVSPPPGLSSSASRSSFSQMNHTEDSSASTREENAVARRQSWLAMLPKAYTPGNRQRCIFMNLDDIAGMLFTSRTLYQRVDGATAPHNVRLNFRALTKYLRGNDSLVAVKCQVATYCKTSQFLAHALVEFGWALKPVVTAADDDKGLHYEMMSWLVESTTTTNENTLVLAMGDGGLSSSSNKTTAYCEIIRKFLEQRWYVEVHGWLYALNDGLLELQAQYPGRVIVKPLDEHIGDLVYLKQQENINMVTSRVNTSLRQFHNSTTTPASSIEPASFLNRPGETKVPNLPASTFDRWSSLRRLSPPLPPSSPQPTVMGLQQQLQQMQDALAALQTSVSTQRQLQQEKQELKKTMRDQANAFEEERKRQAALAAQQASDARLARCLQLENREENLTCPITCELYKEPVTTVCCGKTFSAAVVKQVNECCPWCRKLNFSTHPNRDVAELVEEYRAERHTFDAEQCDESDEEESAEEE